MVKLNVRLSEDGQIVIPEIFSEALNVSPRSEVLMMFEPERGTVILKENTNPIAVLAELSEKDAKRRKGRKLKVDSYEIHEQYDKLAKREGINF